MMLHKWLHGTDVSRKKNLVHIVLLDYSKAFDYIDANISFGKLESMNIHNPILRWLEYFLTDRSQAGENCFYDVRVATDLGHSPSRNASWSPSLQHDH